MQVKTRDILLVTVGVIFWGSASPVVKHLVTAGLHPYLVAYLRLLATWLAAALLLLAGGEQPRLRDLRANWRPLWAMACFGAVLFYGFMAVGMQHTQAGKSTLINAINPAIIVILAHFILKETLTWRHIAGIVVSLTGVILSVAGDPAFDAHSLQFMAGDFMFVGTALCWSVYTIINRLYGRRLSYRGTFFWMFALACLTALPLVLPQLPQLAEVRPGQWLWILFLGFLPGGFGFYAWNRAIVSLGATTCGLINSLLPVSAILISALWLGEQLSGLQLLGGLLVIGGVWLGIQRTAVRTT